MLPKENRLTKNKDFEEIFKKGKGFRENFLFLKILKNKLKVSRFGFVVSNKISKKATVRNKIKRRLREITKKRLLKIGKGFDAVLVVNFNPGLKSFQEIGEMADKLFIKANLFNNEKTSS